MQRKVLAGKVMGRFLPAAMLMAITAAGAAEPLDPELARFSLTPFGGYSFGGTFEDAEETLTVEVDDAAHFGLIFNIREGANTQWEIFYSMQQTDADTAEVTPSQPLVDIDIHYLHIGGTYVADGGRARPFLAATVGG
ncbi:MAG TPA: hypothetical protein VF389_01800, partial [Woeseiaceae bacterium]